MRRLLIAAIAVLISSMPAFGATCSVSEFGTIITDFGGAPINIPLVVAPGPVTQTVTATTPTAVSNAFSSGARFLWVYCDEVMHMQLGTSPTTGLTTDDFRIPAGGFWVGLAVKNINAGDLKIAFCDVDCL